MAIETTPSLPAPSTVVSIKWAAINFAAALTERDADALPAGMTPDRYEIVSGRSFWKVVKIQGSSRYAAAFVSKEDGQVFRANGWSRKGRNLGFTIDQANAAKSLSTGEPRR